MIDKKDVRIRNLIMKITNALVEPQSEIDIDDEFSDEQIKQNFYFKISDIEEYKEEIFEGKKIKPKRQETIKQYIQKHEDAKHEDAKKENSNKEEELKEVYELMYNYFKTFERNQEEFNRNMEKATKLAEQLHYKYLPVYLEQYILNSGVIPEDNLENFYDHFHSIEDLYRYIFTNNKVNWKSTEGDLNIEENMNFEIYTSRWGHHDNYTIKRTTKGWYVEHLIANNGDSAKNGKGALLAKLEHDNVFYPKDGVMYAFETLWEDADTTEMSNDVLQSKLDDISKWIENVEKATHESQPDWCIYY